LPGDRSLQNALFNFGFFVDGMLAVEGTILAKFKFFLRIAPVFRCCIVFSLTFRALQCD
jgi:hypothetical protein